MNSQNLTYQDIFDKPQFDNTEQNFAFGDNSNSSFNAINQQLNNMLDKINNKPMQSNNVSTTNFQDLFNDTPVTKFDQNVENKLEVLAGLIQDIKKQNAQTLQLILDKISNIETKLTQNNQDLQNFKARQKQEFVNLHANFNQQVQAILSAFEHNVANSITEESLHAEAHPQNWEEALENLFINENNNYMSNNILDDAAMQRIIQRSEMYHNSFNA